MKNPLYIVEGQVKVRDDEGKHVSLQPPEPLISFNGRYYPLTCLTSTPGVLPNQVVLTDTYTEPGKLDPMVQASMERIMAGTGLQYPPRSEPVDGIDQATNEELTA